MRLSAGGKKCMEAGEKQHKTFSINLGITRGFGFGNQIGVYLRSTRVPMNYNIDGVV